MLHGWELIVVALVLLLLFGAKKIPELGKGLGEGIRSFKKGISDADADGDADAEIEGEGEDSPDKVENGEESDPKLLP